jgi:hypothetical protein
MGRTCLPASFGYHRDGKAAKIADRVRAFVHGRGCLMAVEVSEGNIGDPSTLASQVAKLKGRFALGNRRMISAP